MSLLKLDIFNVRNIQKQSITPSVFINFIFGENGSGKSSILEAIYILGRAKSFRCTSIKAVINSEQQSLIVAAQLQQSNKIQQLGIQTDGKDCEIRIDQQVTQKRSDLACALPLQLIHPKSYELLDAGPQLRREFLDWGVFNQVDNFLFAWRRFKRALLQRNSLLKTKQLDQLTVWDKELADYGTVIDEYRRQYLQEFKPIFLEILQYFLKVDSINIILKSGWDTSKKLQDVLTEELDKDLRYGSTQNGPHRADFQIWINNRIAKDYVSRGELKLLVLSLKLAQIKFFNTTKNQSACILIDDFSAELDVNNRAKLLEFLSVLTCQVFITATDLTDFGDLNQVNQFKLFHVEQGKIKQL